jgi:phosphonopyruvate decarboxylase
MIKIEDFIQEIRKYGLEPFIEVPCSILAPIIDYILDHQIPLETPANEAIAMGLAAGYYMATGNIPVVMMQNSGLCNALNALTSLHSIYNIPALLIVTWRGEPAIKDAPEHDIMGKKLIGLLETFDLPYKVITVEGYRKEIEEMVKKAKETEKPTVLILRKGIIQGYHKKGRNVNLKYHLSRYDAIRIIKEVMNDSVIYVSTTGFISRSSFNIKDSPDFYMLGSMGLALPIGLAVASKSNRKVVVLDGDGSCLMHAGAMASVGARNQKNLIHIVLDNRAHGSTGNQPSLSVAIDFLKVAEGFGYKKVFNVETELELRDALKEAAEVDGPIFIHVEINQKNPEEKLRRVSDVYSCSEIKRRFMENIKGSI